MFRFFQSCFLSYICLHLVSCNGQTVHQDTSQLSDDFDQAMPFYYKMPNNLSAIDTSPVFKEAGQKILLTGTVFQPDGKTPASNVILYYYQTNSEGIYATKENEERNMPKNKLGQSQGYIRGWVKTDERGFYAIYTQKPGSYPSRNEAAHIHLSVKEELLNSPYYIDNFVFDDDPLLTSKKRKKMENRGGSGVIRFVQQADLWIGERNIILGLNIPDYPVTRKEQKSSGKSIGEDLISFTPFHAYGADKGTKTCPICKYGWYHGILYFVGNRPNWEEIKEWLIFLDQEGLQRADYLKVYFIYGNEENYSKDKRMHELEKLGNELGLLQTALTFVPSFQDSISKIAWHKINPDLENTFLIYKRSTIIDKYIDFKPNTENFNLLTKLLDESENEYFKLSRPRKE